ncbi:MAG TPA: tRNA (guanosine(37)-N1)-methyltransferase TrmD [Abditibacteriaceae bacterium]|jgi:tRNA (guanine37-N1)-methyltransferase
MKFEIFTLFPDYFQSSLNSSIVKRGRESGAIEVGLHDIRAWTHDKHHVCDDAPFGGGAGMVMKAEPLALAIEDVLEWDAGLVEKPPCPVILMSPQGRPFSQRIAEELAEQNRIALVCGHYEGIDERAVETLVTDEISIGDYVLTGGEVAANVIIDAVARLVPGVLGNEASAQGDSFSDGLLEAPHYTRPANWRGKDVPDILLSGNHAAIKLWRYREGLKRTLLRRPDLLESWPGERKLSKAELKIWNELREQYASEDLNNV